MRQYFSLQKIDMTAPWILCVLVVWLCWKIAALIWLVIAPPQPPLARNIALTGQPASVVPNITSFSLFKENQANTSVQAAPEPEVPLKLEGIFLAIPASQSAAVIRVNNVSSRYKVGQQLEGTSQRLAGVAWDHIRLTYADGRESTLYFGDQAANPVAALNVPAVAVTPVPPPTTQTALGDAIRQLQNNPTAYLTQMGVQPTAQGYEVTTSFPAELRNKLGLRPGDRVVALNGRPLGQVQNDIRVLEQIQQQRNAQIEIRRGEQTMTIQQNF